MGITNYYLFIGALLSAIVALLHIGCIIFGAPWYRFFGAGEKIAVLAEQASIIPTIITSFIVLTLLTWSVYAFSGAGVILKLPFLPLVLIVISAIYSIRGVAGFFFIAKPMGRSPQFWLWSSAICLVFGVIHFLGVKQMWHDFY